MMKQMAKMILLTMTGVLSTTIIAAEEVQKTVDAEPNGLVSITNIAGTIEVVGWSRNQVKVEADLGRGVDELIVRRDGDEVKVEVMVPSHNRNSRNISSDLIVHIPENSSIEVVGLSADIEIDLVLGEMRLNSVSGDIFSNVYASDVQIETVSGVINLEGDHGEMLTEISSVSGNIDTDALQGDIVANTINGTLVIDGGSFDRVQARSVDGKIVFDSELRNGGKLQIGSVSGEVDVHFNGSILARFDISTVSSGDINNCFGPESVRVSPPRVANSTSRKTTAIPGSSSRR
ncbi:conserved exported protein of unknown function [uncultured Woeseiaceae bacterium]|uniref:DUF4097 domain-containing protein n=1 Tax=uncultured Woeseiaceae bacterium TaxID=1983305 RepID=A0A7D9D3Z2_9GAMM|nr:conserved exported protein of unknown function [uncultured Woeseiaceae bacterium]